MAIIHFVNYRKAQTNAGMKFVLNYTMQDKKTVSNGKKFVSGINCTPASAYTEFRNTKKLYGKEDGRLFYHFVQSFPVGEKITPEKAHEIALRFASESEKLKGFEIVVSTHCDRDHIHSHFVMNSVNTETGKKFHINENEVEMLMKESDRIIQHYGLSVLPSQPKKQKVKPMSDREYRSADNGQSWKLHLAMMIDDAMLQAISREHFIELMEMEGYSVKWTDERKYITYTTPDGFKCRDNKLHEEKYLKGNMENEFRIRKEITAGIEGAIQTADANSGESRAVYRGYRAELESDDWLTENSGRYADRDDADIGNADHQRRTGTVYERSAQYIDSEQYGLSGGGDEISNRNEESRGGIYRINSNGDIGYRETGWANERAIFENALRGRGQDGEVFEQSVLDFSDADSYFNHLGTDTAYLVAELTDILDSTPYVEDCTTMKQPRQKKKKEQSHGPVMGGM